MTTLNLDLKKIYKFVLSLMPLVAMLGTAMMWVDTRYMHREISDTRFIELQIKILDGHIRDYNRMVDQGATPSAQETIQYELDKEQLKDLMKERNKILGIGDSQQ